MISLNTTAVLTLVIALSVLALTRESCTAQPLQPLTAYREYLQIDDLPRRALVIGIERYDHLTPVPNASNDAELVRSALKNQLHFEAEGRTDGAVPEITADQIRTLTRDFGN